MHLRRLVAQRLSSQLFQIDLAAVRIGRDQGWRQQFGFARYRIGEMNLNRMVGKPCSDLLGQCLRCGLVDS